MGLRHIKTVAKGSREPNKSITIIKSLKTSFGVSKTLPGTLFYILFHIHILYTD